MANREPLIIDAVPERMSREDTGTSRAQARRQSASSAGSAENANAPTRSKWKRALIGVLAVLYVLMPLDLVPDVIPLVGWLDDIGVLAWAARQVFFKK